MAATAWSAGKIWNINIAEMILFISELFFAQIQVTFLFYFAVQQNDASVEQKQVTIF
jgi:hypothetical protein